MFFVGEVIFAIDVDKGTAANTLQQITFKTEVLRL